jgi:Zn finger protein HypA/HybF involved in hydrogenase expression
MPFTVVQEDSAYKCAQCSHVMQLKKGQLLPPCPRCGGAMEKFEGPAATKKDSGCA